MSSSDIHVPQAEGDGQPAAPVTTGVQPATVPPPPSTAPRITSRRTWVVLLGLVLLAVLLILGVPWVREALNTVSSDDAYVNGHVTMVAPRVPSQVVNVLVDDNNRVHKGQLLVELDKEPYQVQVDIAQAAVTAAQADAAAAEAQARGTAGLTRSLRFNLERAIEDVDNQIALLRSKVATLALAQANVVKAQNDYDRVKPLVNTGAIAREELDHRKIALDVAEAQHEEALQNVYQQRVSLGLPTQPAAGGDLTEVPDDLDQTFSSVRQAQASLIQAAAQLGYSDSFGKTPRQMVADFYKQDPQGDIDRIYAELLKNAPAVLQAKARLAQSQRQLAVAQLDLRYCDVTSEIDGIVTRRNVNPGNHVVAGESLMAVRSLDEIWIDANFKETQLGELRIGQPVDLDVDMYGSEQRFKGRISGFTMGTGSTLALLPAENATGNFVKVVQRLPVRIEVLDYDPDKTPLFIGLSVRPVVRVNEPPTGPNAGQILQPYAPQTQVPAGP
jgi:membrane fusion protein, multidrug efflux system